MKVNEKKDSNVGFVRASDGWHRFEITDQSGFLEDREKGEATDTFIVSSQVIGDDEDEGAFMSLFCDLSKKGGRTRLAKMLGFTKVDAIVEKSEKGIDSSLDPAAWGEKYLNIANSKSVKLVGSIKVKLVGATFKGEIKTSKVTSDDGNVKEYQNFINLAYDDVVKSPRVEAPAGEESTGEDEGW